jgi:hypothetical protein
VGVFLGFFLGANTKKCQACQTLGFAPNAIFTSLIPKNSVVNAARINPQHSP